MKHLIRVTFLFLIFFAAPTLRANTDPPTWIDVQNFGADPACLNDSGPAINNAIASVAPNSTGSVIFFPTGCYLINTQIKDISSARGINYLGFGRVQLKSSFNLATSIMQFGDDTHTAVRRRIEDLYFVCGSQTGVTMGITLDGLTFSQFDNVEFQGCGYGMTTVGNNLENYSNVFEGGGLSSGVNGIYLGYGADNWTFKGSRFLGRGIGTGIDFEGYGNACLGCRVTGWTCGITQGLTSSAADGLEISGGLYTDNLESIHIGYGDVFTSISTNLVRGVSIHGAFFRGSPSLRSRVCIELQAAKAFTISGNTFQNCGSNIIEALNPSDNGIIGPNDAPASEPPNVGPTVATLFSSGQVTVNRVNSTTNCVSGSAAGNTACGSASAGSIGIFPGQTSFTINTSAVTANSQILLTSDSSLSARLDENSCSASPVPATISARNPGVGFTISLGAPIHDWACFNWLVVN